MVVSEGAPEDSVVDQKEETEEVEVDLLVAASVVQHGADPEVDSVAEVVPEAAHLVEAQEVVLVEADADH